MCVIAKGARKDLGADEFRQCMKTNGYGFFVAVLRKTAGANTFVRTLDPEEAFKVYEAADPDDTVVLHARIPSRGGHEKNLADVHGWVSEEGIRFCHNGTLVQLDGVQKADGCEKMTDSEYFFRRIFLPLYRSQGNRWTELVDRIVKVMCCGNRFLFIFPDGTVKTVGQFIEDHNCVFSNRSYIVPRPYAPRIHFNPDSSFSAVKPFAPARPAPTPVQATWFDEPDVPDAPGCAKALLDAIGRARLIRLSALSLAATSLTARAARSIFVGAEINGDIAEALVADMFRGLPHPLGPTVDFGKDLVEIFADATSGASSQVTYAIDGLADLFGDALVAKAVPGTVAQTLTRDVGSLEERVKALLKTLHNARIDMSADNPSAFVKAFGIIGSRVPKIVARSQQFVYGGVADVAMANLGLGPCIVPGVRVLLREAAKSDREGVRA